LCGIKQAEKECDALKNDKHVLECKVGDQENILNNVRSDRENWREKFKEEHKVAEEFRAYKRLTIDVSDMKSFRERLEETIAQANTKMKGRVTKIDITYMKSVCGPHDFYTNIVMEG
jgi:hypothetical protein